jgi:hypothetical protein
VFGPLTKVREDVVSPWRLLESAIESPEQQEFTMNQHFPFFAALAAIAALGAGAPPSAAKDGAPNSVFQKPVQLKAADAVIDSGPQWAHSGPCLHDVDGDGRRDLLVGDFSGQFQLYRNVGTDQEPKFTAGEWLMAGGEVAKVPIY